MIYRMTHKLFKRLRERPLDADYEGENPFVDWGADHFTLGGQRYILICNRASVLSWLIDGKGVNSLDDFQREAGAGIRDCLAEYGFELHYERIIVPSMQDTRIRKVGDRNLTGILMDMVKHAKFHLSYGEDSMIDVSRRLNKMPQCSRKDPFPIKAFAQLSIK